LDGGVYAGNRSEAATRKFGSIVKEGDKIFNLGHGGPVNSVVFHPPQPGTDFGSLFLSSSVDWTVKVWSLGKENPIFSFTSSDYVFDAAWSPTHPAVFAAADCTGSLSIWNLNEDTEKPTMTLKVGDHGLYRLRWSPDGTQLAVGDCVGRILVYDVADEVAVPKAEETKHLVDLLRKYQAGSN